MSPSSRRFRGIVFFTCLFLYSCLKSGGSQDGEIYYIPEGVTGSILVLFDCEDGKPEQWKDGKRLYLIPPSGILKTQFKANTGWILFEDQLSETKK
ncbi:hypothetical protein A8C32_10040 [Flavivirga aquatica]|uniref:DUF6843 domain-containing protein n=2 Tax=Flavivirga aquatica TaxID=1849968 RepID=A0A1E5TEP9_9FLAO|nr:hypothetical protein A8C32_10040 [Flavivirga aquatica]